MPVTERDKAVWSAYIGSAIALPHVQANPDALDALTKAQTAAAAGKTAGLAKMLIGLLEAIEPSPTDHPSRQGRAQAALVNIGVVIAELGGVKDTAEDAPADEPKDTDTPSDDGKVDCPCGKRHNADAKVLAKHQALAGAGR